MSFHSLSSVPLVSSFVPNLWVQTKGPNKHHRITGRLMSLDTSAQTGSPNNDSDNIFVEVSFYYHCSNLCFSVHWLLLLGLSLGKTKQEGIFYFLQLLKYHSVLCGNDLLIDYESHYHPVYFFRNMRKFFFISGILNSCLGCSSN